MILSHSKAFIFIKTRKTAGTSVQDALWRMCDFETDIRTWGKAEDDTLKDAHISLLGVKERFKEDYDNSYFKFTIERNPWDKVVSLYWWLVDHISIQQTFSEWVKVAVSKDPTIKGREHYLPTDFHLYTENGQVLVNSVLRYEFLIEDFSFVCKTFDLPWDGVMPREKATQRPKGIPYHAYYDEETRKLVEKAFHQEIRLFKYEFVVL